MTTGAAWEPGDRSVRPRVVGRGPRVASVLLWVGVAVLLLLGLGLRWGLRSNQPLNLDEYQHLHIAWCWTQDLTPYRDFWDNHPPALHVLLSALQGLRGETVETIQVDRAAMFVLALALLAVTFELARAAFDSATGLAAVAVLAWVPIFTQKTVEVRPDGGLILFALLTVWLLLRAVQAGPLPVTFAFCAAAGFTFGLATVFSTKSMMLAVALLVGLIGLAVRRRRTLRPTVVLAGMALALLGFLIAVGPWVIYLAGRGALSNMLRFTVLDNVTYPERFSFLRSLGPTWSTSAAVILVLGLLLAVIEQFARGRHRDAALVLLLVAGTLSVQFALVMPAPHPQSACLPIAFLAVLGGRVLRSAIGWVTGPHCARWLACCGGLVALFIIAAGTGDVVERLRSLHQPDSDQPLRQQLRMTRRLLKLTGPDDAVFAHFPIVPFRRHACFYPTLVNAVLQWYHEGGIATPIADDLRRFGCTMVVVTLDKPIPPDDRHFIRTRFVSFVPSVLVPGQRYLPRQLRGGPLVFDAVTAGVYAVDAADPVHVDGHGIVAEIFLDAGPHTIECADPSGPVTIYRPPGQ